MGVCLSTSSFPPRVELKDGNVLELRDPASPKTNRPPLTNHVEAVLRLYDDSEILRVFDKYKDTMGNGNSSAGTLSAPSLMKACEDLGLLSAEAPDRLLPKGLRPDFSAVSFEEFKRIVRWPSEEEQWVQMMPLAGLLSRCLGKTGLDELVLLTEDEVQACLSLFSQGVEILLRKALERLKHQLQKLHVVNASSGDSKFGGQLEGGTVEDFHRGLSERLGYPHPEVEKGLEEEHCVSDLGCDEVFTTTNYDITTTPKREYRIAQGLEACPEDDRKDKARKKVVREVKMLPDLEKSTMVLQAKLIRLEVLAVVLYSGPMFQVYNTMLRQPSQGKFLADLYEKFKAKNNLFSTTIHVLVSAVVKLTRATRLPSGLKLYRGLGKDLPESFYKEDEYGRRGYMEWGFVSTTSDELVACQYSGADIGKRLGMVLCLEATSIDRGACIRELSQYPGEVEYLFVPCSFVEPTGLRHLEEAREEGGDGGGLLWMVHVRINANLKSLTVEELEGRKRDMHLAAFKYLLAETERGLRRIVGEVGSQRRWERDVFAQKNATTLEDLVRKLVAGAHNVLSRHENVKAGEYGNIEVYRGLVEEMLHTRVAAESALRCYVEDPGAYIVQFLHAGLKALHRRYINFLWISMPKTGLERNVQALRLCKMLGLVQRSAQEVDEEGMTPLMLAAAAGSGARSLRCIVAAGADIDKANNDGKTALMAAAASGYAEVIEVLASLGADVNKADKDGRTSVVAAAQFGHAEAIKALASLGADVNHADNTGWTGLMAAAQGGSAEAIKALASLGADVERADNTGRTATAVAASGGHTEAIKALADLGADVDKAEDDGWTAVIWAAAGGHAGAIKVLASLGADVNKAGDMTAVMVAASWGGHAEAIKVLADLGADVNKAGIEGKTAVAAAAQDGNMEVIKVLADLGAEVNQVDNKGITAVMEAAAGGHAEAVKLLASLGADAHKADKDGKTAVMMAAAGGHIDAIKALADLGADVDQAEHDGWTAVMQAAAGGHAEAVKLLASLGADIHKADKDGKTAVMEAAAGGHAKALEMLYGLGVPRP